MDDISKFKEIAKQAMKQHLRRQVSSSWDKYMVEMQTTVQAAVDGVANQVLDETKIEEIANNVRAGASYVATQEFIRRVTEDAIKQAYPLVTQVAKALSDLMIEATAAAIKELLQERIQQALIPKRDQGGKP